VAGDWRRLHNEELHDLYASSNIIRAIKSRRMRWAVHVPRMGKIRRANKILFGNVKGGYSLGDLGVCCRIILKWIRWEDVDCIHLTQDRDQWRPLVFTVMNLQLP
jgi:hypothetical protein